MYTDILCFIASLSAITSLEQWQTYGVCLWHECQAVVAGVGELHLKQGIRGTIVFVKSIFGHYQLLLYLLNGATLLFVRLQTRVFIKENCSLFISKLQQTTKDNKKTLCKSQGLPLKVFFIAIKHHFLLCSTFGHNSDDNFLLSGGNGTLSLAHVVVGIAAEASD